MPTRQPSIYLPHGGGPWPFIQMPPAISDPAGDARLTAYLKGLSVHEPSAILVVSAHWEEARPTVMTHAKPPLYYDYSGFPAHTYELKWPAPGAPDLADRVVQLLSGAGIEHDTNPTRGFDHGTFIPLMLTWPEPTIPTTQLSLVKGLDPRVHLAIGQALAPLRDEGVLIVGSGMSFHNMRAFGNPQAGPQAEAFDAWVRETALLGASERNRRLANWTDAPAARFCHPREEHLIPLMVCAGAAGSDPGSVPFNDQVLRTAVSAVHFG